MARLRYWGIDAQSEFSNDWRNANQQLASILMKYPSVQIVSPNGANFLSHAPFYEGRLIYHDEHHLNELGSIKYGSFLEDVLTKAGNQ